MRLPEKTWRRLRKSLLPAFSAWCFAESAQAYTANNVHFTFLNGSRYRVTVGYTIPELREFRESYVEFTSYKDASRFYFDLVRGADFFPEDPKTRRFQKAGPKPEPW